MTSSPTSILGDEVEADDFDDEDEVEDDAETENKRLSFGDCFCT